MLEISKERPGTIQKKTALLDQITSLVDEHLMEKLTLKEVAAYCGVSVSTVTQLFQKRSHTTFHGFITERRLELAKGLIAAGTPLEQVGKEVGYRDHSTFYRAFRTRFGISPREYRCRLLDENIK